MNLYERREPPDPPKGRTRRQEMVRDTNRRARRLRTQGPKEPTRKQLDYLQALGYRGPTPKTRSSASWQIDALLARGKKYVPLELRGRATAKLATDRQLELLARLGYDGPRDITAQEALALHSRLRQAGSSSPG